MAGWRFDIGVDTAKLKRGTDEAADAIGDLVDEFVDLERDGARSLDDVAEAFGDTAREADDAGRRATDALDDVGRAADDVADKTSDAGRTATDALDDVARAADDVADKTGDVGEDGARSLDELGDAADDAARKIDRELIDATDEAGDSADRLEKKFRDALSGTSADAAKAGGDIGDKVSDGFDRASEGADEFKDEANSTAREAAASFDGTADSIVDMFQEVSANAFAGFGPAGAAAGLAAAAGIGILITKLQTSAEDAETTKQRVIELADAIREADGDIAAIDWGEIVREWGNEYADVKSWFEPWQRSSVTNFEAMEEAADRFGLSYSSLVQGMAGNTESAREAIAELDAEIEAQADVVDNLALSTMSYDSELSKTNATERERLRSLEDLRADLMESSGLTEEAIEHEQRMAEALEGTAAATEERNDQLAETIELTRDVIDSELDYLDALDEGTEKLAENAEAGFDKNTAAGRDNLRVLGDMTDKTLEYADALAEETGSQEAANEVIRQGRERIIKAAEGLGMGREAAERYADSLGLIPREVHTTAKAHTSAAVRALEHLQVPRSVPVQPSFNRYAWQRELTNTIGGLRVPAIVAQVRFGQAAV